MHFHRRFIPGLAAASYIIGDDKTGRAVVIDPIRDASYYVAYARRQNLHITDIIETHVHADFVSGSYELKASLDGQPTIHCSSEGGDRWTPSFMDHSFGDGASLQFGDLAFEAFHTPGHTPEHISITLKDLSRSKECPWLMFSGDFLFVGDIGRPDLLGEKEKKELAHQLYQSLFDKLPGMPDFTEIFPAHGEGSLCGKAIGSRRSSTLGYERLFNQALQQRPEAEWVQQLMEDMPLAPDYFKRMKELNSTGPALLQDLPFAQKRWALNDFDEARRNQHLVLDIRSKEAFAAGHIEGAVNIPMSQNLSTWAGWVLPADRPMLLVSDDTSHIKEATTQLRRVGYDDVRGFLEGGIGAWMTAGKPLSTLDTCSVDQLAKEQDAIKRGQLTVLDVRTEREWQSGHIEGAKHIHAGTLKHKWEALPKDRPTAVVCGSGYRASIAASQLKRFGFERVTNVLGGMAAWNNAGFPTV